MASSVVLIMASSWARSTLHWWPDQGWTREDDRPHAITDDGVLARFGDEAFRRRDALQASGEWRYEPLSAPLIGRRISERIAQAGWSVQVASRTEFRVERNGSIISVDGRSPGLLRLDSMGHSRETERIDSAEHWLLEAVLGPEGTPDTDKIASVSERHDRDSRIQASLDAELAAYGRSVLAPRFPGAELKVVSLPEDDAVYVYPDVRGGGILIVARDRTALFAASSIQIDEAIAEFRKGRRSVIRPHPMGTSS